MLAIAKRNCAVHEDRLSVAGRVVKVSSFYETEPMEFTEQPWFLNCAVELETGEGSHELMATIVRIEQEMGRRRVQQKGPTIDRYRYSVVR